MKAAPIASAAFFLLSTTALAQSEGVADFKVSISTARGETIPGRGTFSLSRNAVRAQWEVDLRDRDQQGKPGAPKQYRTSLIYRLSDPDKMYMLNDDRKTYWIMDLKKGRENAGEQEKYTVRKLGRGTVAGLGCEKALVVAPSGMEIELCVTRELVASSAWLDAMNRHQAQSGMTRALRDAGVEGFPIRSITREPGGKRGSSTFELVRFEKKSVPSSTFDIPAGYRETSAAAGNRTPQQQKAMKDALSRMTPEQRKMYEDMMKKQKEKP